MHHALMNRSAASTPWLTSTGYSTKYQWIHDSLYFNLRDLWVHSLKSPRELNHSPCLHGLRSIRQHKSWTRFSRKPSNRLTFPKHHFDSLPRKCLPMSWIIRFPDGVRPFSYHRGCNVVLLIARKWLSFSEGRRILLQSCLSLFRKSIKEVERFWMPICKT